MFVVFAPNRFDMSRIFVFCSKSVRYEPDFCFLLQIGSIWAGFLLLCSKSVRFESGLVMGIHNFMGAEIQGVCAHAWFSPLALLPWRVLSIVIVFFIFVLIVCISNVSNVNCFVVVAAGSRNVCTQIERKTPQKRNSAAKVQRNLRTAKYFSTFYSSAHEIKEMRCRSSALNRCLFMLSASRLYNVWRC